MYGSDDDWIPRYTHSDRGTDVSLENARAAVDTRATQLWEDISLVTSSHHVVSGTLVLPARANVGKQDDTLITSICMR